MTIYDTPILSPILKFLSHAVLRLVGWRKGGPLPDVDKCIVIGAPHTSNWDLPLVLTLALAYGAPMHWMAKKSVFRWPFGGICRWMGGIPVDRSKRCGAVEQTAQLFRNSEKLKIVISPEGTRGVSTWKTGFYYIAYTAGIPIVPAFLDYRTKRGGLTEPFYPTGDIVKDMEFFRDFYGRITARYPELFQPPRLSDADIERAKQTLGQTASEPEKGSEEK